MNSKTQSVGEEMDYDIEKTAKDGFLAFFLETTEPYINQLPGYDICTLGKWLSKVYKMDIYSMKTYLLLMHHMIRKGNLASPFNEDPAKVILNKFEPENFFTEFDTPAMNNLVRKASQKAMQNKQAAHGRETNGECAATIRGLETNVECPVSDRTFKVQGRTSRPLVRNQFVIPRRDMAYTSYANGHQSRSQSQPRENASYCVENRRSASSDRCYGQNSVCYDKTSFNMPDHDMPGWPATSTPRKNAAHRPLFPLSPISRQQPSRIRIPPEARDYVLRQAQRVLDEQERDWYNTPCCPSGTYVSSQVQGSVRKSKIPVLQKQCQGPCAR